MRMLTTLLLMLCLAACSAPESTRIYVFDNGKISGLDPALFNFSADELAEVDFVNSSYLIVHPDGTLMFDAGALPDEAFAGHEGPVVEGIMSATQALAPQLASAGYAPEDIDFFAMSHYHSDHTANANLFAGSTWIVLLSTPGHTPGHQLLVVNLENAGWIVLAGDLYHYPEERTTGRTPTFEFDAELSRRSRARVEAFLQQTDGTLWIEHDIATHAALPMAPDYVD